MNRNIFNIKIEIKLSESRISLRDKFSIRIIILSDVEVVVLFVDYRKIRPLRESS